METKIQSLPPLKRLRLLHQEEQQRESESESWLRLPAKKRKECWDPPVFSDSAVGMTGPMGFWLPAKKRVWALDPNYGPSLPTSFFDLNVEYKPDLEEREIKETNSNSKSDLDVEGNRDLEEREIKETNLSLDPKSDIDVGCNLDLEEREIKETNLNSNSKSVLAVTEELLFNEEEDEDGIVCAICESTDGDPEDPIVFCDGCDVMVHVTCYGNPLIKGIPEGDWFCAKCSAIKSSSQQVVEKCCLCPVEGGALKLTNDKRWAHIVCALFVPEVFFEDPEGREGIDCSKVPKRRWKEVCYVCKRRRGCAIECSEPNCELAFHVSCGLNEGLCIEYKQSRRTSKSGGIVAGFCKDHTELWSKQQGTGKFKIVARD